MSKHTVLICAGAPAPALDKMNDYYRKYRKEALIIGVDRGALLLANEGYTLDYAIGDFDSVSDSEFETIKDNARNILTSPAMKDESDLELALLELFKMDIEFNAIYIFGGLGENNGRLDHMFSNLWIAYREPYQSYLPKITFIEKHQELFFIKDSRKEVNYNRQYRYLSVISLTAFSSLEIQDAVYTLEAMDSDIPRAFISNEFKENENIKISVDKGIVMVFLSELDRKE